MAQGASQSIEAAFELFNLFLEDRKEIQDLYFEKRLERTKLVNSRDQIKLSFFSFI